MIRVDLERRKELSAEVECRNKLATVDIVLNCLQQKGVDIQKEVILNIFLVRRFEVLKVNSGVGCHYLKPLIAKVLFNF